MQAGRPRTYNVRIIKKIIKIRKMRHNVVFIENPNLGRVNNYSLFEPDFPSAALSPAASPSFSTPAEAPANPPFHVAVWKRVLKKIKSTMENTFENTDA